MIARTIKCETTLFGQVVYALEQVDVFLAIHTGTSGILHRFEFREFCFPITQKRLIDTENIGHL